MREEHARLDVCDIRVDGRVAEHPCACDVDLVELNSARDVRREFIAVFVGIREVTDLQLPKVA